MDLKGLVYNFSPRESFTQNYSHDPTALEVLSNYAKINTKEDIKSNFSKSTGRPGLNYTYELGGMLVYDDKAKILETSPTPTEKPEQPEFPIQEITELNLNTYLQSKKFTPCPEFTPEYTFSVPSDDNTLVFNSKFESGNLKKAIKMGDYEYKLLINPDTNTYRHNHWYYFSVFNPKKTCVTFSIINMLKLDDLYRTGMHPAVFSHKYFEKTGVKWHRDGYKISYSKAPEASHSNSYYTLSFTYDFRFSEDLVYFAYSVPYTYEELSNYLYYIKEKHHKIARVNPLCKTIAGNVCEMITITENIRSYISFENEQHEWNISSSGRRILRNKKIRKSNQAKLLGKNPEEEHDNKSGIVLTARVHSGETVSSFMMRGTIDFLLGESREAKALRKKFVFKIIPMLNPDGVRYGNYRCSLLGVDLNRRWEKPNKNLFPTIYYAKKMIEVFGEHHKILMYCDMHGHAKKRNVFMYGCAKKSMDCLTIRRNLLAKVIPNCMSKKSKFFMFKNCHFRIEKSKMSTARIVLYTEFEITHSYTIESSFFGPNNKKCEKSNYQMTEKDFESIGEDLCKVCMIFTSQSLYLSKIRSTNDYLRRIIYKKTTITIEKNDQSSDESKEDEEEKKFEEENSLILIQGTDAKQGFVRPEDEKIWKGIDIVQYSESDEEGSGGSDSCPSEKIQDLQDSPSKKKPKKERKNFQLVENFTKQKLKVPPIQAVIDTQTYAKANISLYSKASVDPSKTIKPNLETSNKSEPLYKKSNTIISSNMKSNIIASDNMKSRLDDNIKSSVGISEYIRADADISNSSGYTKSNIDIHPQQKPEKLKKTHSLRPKLKVMQPKNSKEESSKYPVAISNLASENILFNYPLPYINIHSKETPPESFIKSQKEASLKKTNFSKSIGPTEDRHTSPVNIISQPLNYSFKRPGYKKKETDLPISGIFTSVPSNFLEHSWITSRKKHINTNYPQSSRHRLFIF